ncbi:MAG: signal peptidase II [Pseudomonadota bacterium]
MIVRALVIALVALVLDQATKWYVMYHVMVPPREIIVTGFFNLVLTFNKGISFGLFSGNADWQPYILSAIAAVISVVLLFWLKSQPTKINGIAVGLIVGGAIGNVIDRLRIGAVVDFLDFHLASYHWPAFNIADAAIFCGVALILFDGLNISLRERKKAKSEEGDR